MLYAGLSALVGLCIVLQNGWNRRLAEPLGLATTLVWNSLAVLALSVALYAIAVARPGWVPEIFHPTASRFASDWRAPLPGIAGFLIVAGMPWAISRLGAVSVLSVVIAVQIGAAALWDLLVEGIALTPARVLGSLLALAGALLALKG